MRGTGPRGGGAAWAAGLALLAVLLYWPAGTWFQGDDFIAVTYARDISNVAHDFTGPQYDLTGHTLFWRPLVTLSFGIESLLFGGNPFGYHLDNALVHGLNTLLLFLLLGRHLGRKWALGAALLWTLHPAQALPILWTVGRVDIHCVFWMLLSLLLFRRRLEGRGRTAWALLAFAAALATKELALVLPGLALGAAWLTGKEDPLIPRARGAFQAALPFFLLLVPYFIARKLFLGHFLGGYMAEQADLAGIPGGLARWTARLLFPLGSGLGERALGGIAPYAAWAGFSVWLILAVLFLRKYGLRKSAGGLAGGLAVGAGLFLLGCVPVYVFLSQPWELKHLRYFYLPLAGLAVLASAGGWRGTILVLALYIPVHFPVRGDFRKAMDYDRKVHLGLLETASRLEGSRPFFVKESPPDTGIAVTLFLGLERMLLPPFGPGRPSILRWRPFLFPWQDPLVFSEEELRFPLEPMAAVTPGGEVRLGGYHPPALPEFQARFQGPLPLGEKELAPLAMGTADYKVSLSPPTPGVYRILWLTPLGYLACRVPAEKDGSLSLRRILLSPVTRSGKGTALFLPLALSLDISPSLTTYLILERVEGPGGRVLSRAAGLLEITFHPSAVPFLLLQKR